MVSEELGKFVFLKALGVVVIVAVLLLLLADCTVIRRREFVEVEMVAVHSASAEDEYGLPRRMFILENTTGQMCVGDKVRALKTRGGIFGWFPVWYLIEAVGE